MCNLYFQVTNIINCKSLKANDFERFFLMFFILAKNNDILNLKSIDRHLRFAILYFSNELKLYFLIHVTRFIVNNGPNLSVKSREVTFVQFFM